MNNTMKLLSIGTIFLILLATIPISTAKNTLDDKHLPIAVREKVEEIVNNIQPLTNGNGGLILFLIILIIILVLAFGGGGGS